METTILGFGLRDILGFYRDIISIMENQMEKKMEDDMETGDFFSGLLGVIY